MFKLDNEQPLSEHVSAVKLFEKSADGLRLGFVAMEVWNVYGSLFRQPALSGQKAEGRGLGYR